MDPRHHPTRPSTVTLPARPPDGVTTIFAFFVSRFPKVPQEVWRERFASGKVFTAGGPVTPDAPYEPRLEVHYRREVAVEPLVRTDWRTVYEDAHLMVVDKPPFLPVTPAGAYVRSCLLHLVDAATGNPDVVPLHRLDRDTSGLVMLSINRVSRSHYARLFADGGGLVEKEYLAVCYDPDQSEPRQVLAGHVARDPAAWWRQAVLPGRPANALVTTEEVLRQGPHVVLRVRPTGGRKHQIRVLLASAGLPVVNDRVYGTAPAAAGDDLGPPMLLDCHRLTVRGFGGFADTPPLDATWCSARTAETLLAAALATGEIRT